jgi:hypothetical protein
MRSWLHGRMHKRATLPRHVQTSAKLKRISKEPNEDADSYSARLASPPQSFPFP